jgi:hypothetical protein
MGRGFTDITRKDEPIGRMACYLQERPLISFITQVKIAYRKQFHTACPLLWGLNVRYCISFVEPKNCIKVMPTPGAPTLVLPNADESRARRPAARQLQRPSYAHPSAHTDKNAIALEYRDSGP